MGAIEADIALALLLGIVERMRVNERPDELAADVFEAEFEMRVVIDGVAAAVESGGADIYALLVGDLFGVDQARRITSAGGGDCGIVRMREGVAKRDARRGGFHQVVGGSPFEHAGLRGHVGLLFYTRGEDLIQRAKSRQRSSARPGNKMRLDERPALAKSRQGHETGGARTR